MAEITEQEKENIKKVWLEVAFSFHAVDSDLLGSRPTSFSVLEEVTLYHSLYVVGISSSSKRMS